MAPNNNPVFSPKVHQKVTPLETAQYNNEVLTSGVTSPIMYPSQLKKQYYRRIIHKPVLKHYFLAPLQNCHTHFTRSSTNNFVAQSIVNPAPTHHCDNHVFNPDTGNILT